MDQDNLFADEKLSPQQERTLKEMGRMSLDRIRVRNITADDYYIRWDGLNFLVPGKDRDIGFGSGEAVHPRYIAVKFSREITDKILGQEMVEAVREENDRRIKGGMAKMNKWEEEPVFANQFNPNNIEQRTKILTMVWLGVEAKYGMDTPIEEEGGAPRRDPRNIDEDILAKLERPVSLNDLPSKDNLDDIITPTQAKEEVFDAIEGNTNGQ